MTRKKLNLLLLLISLLVISSLSIAYAESESLVPNNSIALFNSNTKKLEVFDINYLFTNVQEATNRINQLISSGYTSLYYQLDGAQNTWADIFNPSVAEEEIINTMSQAEEINFTDKDGKTTPVTTEPSISVNFSPDSLLGQGFSLGTMNVNVRNVEGAAKYAVRYTVSNAKETVLVTTPKYNIGETTTDLVQYIEDKTQVDIIVYGADGQELEVFEKVEVK